MNKLQATRSQHGQEVTMARCIAAALTLLISFAASAAMIIRGPSAAPASGPPTMTMVEWVNNNDTATSTSKALTANPQSGDLLVAIVAIPDTSSMSGTPISDDIGDSGAWSSASPAWTPFNSNAGSNIFVYTKKVGPGASNKTVTTTPLTSVPTMLFVGNYRPSAAPSGYVVENFNKNVQFSTTPTSGTITTTASTVMTIGYSDSGGGTPLAANSGGYTSRFSISYLATVRVFDKLAPSIGANAEAITGTGWGLESYGIGVIGIKVTP